MNCFCDIIHHMSSTSSLSLSLCLSDSVSLAQVAVSCFVERNTTGVRCQATIFLSSASTSLTGGVYSYSAHVIYIRPHLNFGIWSNDLSDTVKLRDTPDKSTPRRRATLTSLGLRFGASCQHHHAPEDFSRGCDSIEHYSRRHNDHLVPFIQ